MKKSIVIFLGIALFFLFTSRVNAAISSGTGALSPGGGVSACSEGICYSTNIAGSTSHIGIRFSLVTMTGESTEFNVDLLTSNLKDQLTKLNDKVAVFSEKGSEMRVSSLGDKWSDYKESKTVGATVISKNSKTIADEANPHSWYINNLNDIVVNSSTYSGQAIYNHFFGGDGSSYLIQNYNMGNDNGHSVFYTDGGTDHNALNDILQDMVYQLKADELNSKGYMIQIEPITIILFTANGHSTYIYGTTSEIRAIASQFAAVAYGTNKAYNIAVLFNDDDSTYKENGKLIGYSALSYLNTGMYANVKLGGSSYGGEDGVCTGKKYGTQYNWLDPSHHNCGIGIITGFGDNNTCKVIKDADGTWFYGKNGERLNDFDPKPGEAYIGACVCDISQRKVTNEDNWTLNLDKFSDTDKAYKEEWCTPPTTITVHEEDPCDVEVNDRVCDDGKDEDEKDETYTFTVGNKDINACVLKSIDKTTYTGSGSDRKNYTQYSNNYCQIACAENFKITMPTKKSAKAGTYFDFNGANEKVEVDGNRVCSSKVDYNKFYTDMFNNGGSESSINNSDLSYDFGNRGIQDTSTFEIKTNGTEYTGGLDQQVRDYSQLVNYFDYFSHSYNYSSDNYCSGNSNCGEHGNECCKWDTKYYSTSKQGGIEVSCTTEDSSTCSGTSLADSYSTKLTAAKAALESAKSARQAIIDEVNKCTETVHNTGINNNGSVNYTYDEGYAIGGFRLKSSTSNSLSTIYCQNLNYDSINNTFTCNGNASSTKQSISGIYDCTSDNCKIYKIPYTAKLDKKIKQYESDKYFYTNPGTGIVQTYGSDLTNPIGNVMPIKLNNVGGTFNYYFTIKNLGDYLRKQDVKYACYYDVGKDVTINKDKDPEQPNDKLNFFYRNVSLNNFDPNNRKDSNQLGYNWNTEKGKKTMCLITGGTYELDGTCRPKSNTAPEEIYDEEAEYSFTLTPENMQDIRTYNKTQEEYGGFNNFKMTKLESTTYDGEGYWYTSDFVRNTSYFSYSKIEPTWELWSGSGIGKLTGIGPAWK